LLEGAPTAQEVEVIDTPRPCTQSKTGKPSLTGKRVGMVVFSPYPADPRPRRAAEALLSEGMELDYICEGDERLPKREIVAGGMNVIRLPLKHHRGGKISYAYQYSAFILLSACILAWRSLRKKYALIYVHNMPDVLVFCALFPKMLGAKVILDQHDPMPELMKTIFNLGNESLAVRVIWQLEKLSVSFADLVVTVNVACKRLFSDRGCRPEKIGIVMNSPDDKIFPYQAARSYDVNRSPTRPFVVMYHGSLVERNGLDLAVKALVRVRRTIPNIELKICGKATPFLDRVMEEARGAGLDGAIRYLGSKRLEELVGEIQNCDVGIIPNQRNAFTDINTPTRIFEYLALGKPVIAPETPGIRDYFGRDDLLYFDSGNADSLSLAITKAYSGASEMIELAERGQQVYLAHTWQREREMLVNLVSDLLKGAQLP